MDDYVIRWRASPAHAADYLLKRWLLIVVYCDDVRLYSWKLCYLSNLRRWNVLQFPTKSSQLKPSIILLSEMCFRELLFCIFISSNTSSKGGFVNSMIKYLLFFTTLPDPQVLLLQPFQKRLRRTQRSSVARYLMQLLLLFRFSVTF